MELTQLKSVISTSLTKIFAPKPRRRNRNGGSAGRLTSSLGAARNGAAFLNPKALQPYKEFEANYSTDGWMLRSHLNDPRFRLSDLEGKEVVFCLSSDDGEVKEYRGVVAGSYQAGSALFRLEGQDEIFNSNYCAKLAVSV